MFIRLSGGELAGEECPVEAKRNKVLLAPNQLAAEAQAGLGKLIARYDDPATPYLSRPRPTWIVRPGDYDHLARVNEWSSALGDDA
jgi:ATP-dependent helicase/nuclease subunit B